MSDMSRYCRQNRNMLLTDCDIKCSCLYLFRYSSSPVDGNDDVYNHWPLLPSPFCNNTSIPKAHVKTTCGDVFDTFKSVIVIISSKSNSLWRSGCNSDFSFCNCERNNSSTSIQSDMHMCLSTGVLMSCQCLTASLNSLPRRCYSIVLLHVHIICADDGIDDDDNTTTNGVANIGILLRQAVLTHTLMLMHTHRCTCLPLKNVLV